MIKEKKYAGADERTPSIPQYFSWINNTNEGSTENQTLINLDFFRYLKETYGMQIRIYAWDAGNFDGASEGYGNLNSKKFKEQYPEGYRNVVKEAEKIGIRFGLWGSPDGYGDTEETQKERFDFFVHLCKDYNFALFKLDGVCGQLRKEKADVFANMLKECRKYSPDLIVLNHRLELYKAEKYVTTYLWNGEETYTDVFTHNQKTGMHNRVYLFNRGHVDNLERLAEDHGVCLSSSLDYFEDELIYQAFSRCLILAPEMYGNPWFLKDSEFSKLAYVYNLHKRNSDILTNGIRLSKKYGCNAVSRGNDIHRFVCTGNDSWETKFITLKPEKIGIKSDNQLDIIQRFPYVKYLGTINSNESIEIELLPFRATLIEIGEKSAVSSYIPDFEYEVIKEDESGNCIEFRKNPREKVPQYIGSLKEVDKKEYNCESLYEAAMYSVNNDSLESRCILRSGKSEIPEVTKAREAFFNQKTYKLRGCEFKNMFDKNDESFYDSQSRTYCGGLRINGGCLRVDFGKITDADCIEIECFSTDTETNEVKYQLIPDEAEVSKDLATWIKSPLFENKEKCEYTQETVKFKVHTTYQLKGHKNSLRYKPEGKFRYLRISNPPDRIYAVRLYKNGKEIKVNNPKGNNLMSDYRQKKTVSLQSASFTLPVFDDGSYLSVAIEGNHGPESVYCAVEVDGKLMGFPRRAPDWKANVWEHLVCDEKQNNTFYFPLSSDLKNIEIKIYAMFSKKRSKPIPVNVYICPEHK